MTVYYEVVDLVRGVNTSVEIAKLDYGRELNIWVSHDRRLYGKYYFFSKVTVLYWNR